jgi:hypothetical protein
VAGRVERLLRAVVDVRDLGPAEAGVGHLVELGLDLGVVDQRVRPPPAELGLVLAGG